MMNDPHRHRVQANDVPNVMSVEPQTNGEVRIEVYAGVEVGFLSRLNKDRTSMMYQVAIYKAERRYRQLTDDFEEAAEMFSEAMKDPKSFREGCGVHD